MKGCVLIFLLVVTVALAADTYSTKYDAVNIDAILNNDRVLANYIKCLLDEGPCTNEGRELRKTLPDALGNGCSKCSQKQKDIAQKVINHMMTKKVKEWERLTAKFDPTGTYKKRYEQELKASTSA